MTTVNPRLIPHVARAIGFFIDDLVRGDVTAGQLSGHLHQAATAAAVLAAGGDLVEAIPAGLDADRPAALTPPDHILPPMHVRDDDGTVWRLELSHPASPGGALVPIGQATYTLAPVDPPGQD